MGDKHNLSKGLKELYPQNLQTSWRNER